MKNNTNKMIMGRNGDWYVEHGYQHPNDIIDHNANLQLPEKFIQIFSAYNQHNIAEDAQWDTWPEWELTLTSMDDFLTFGEPETEPPEMVAEREHWLALMQFMHDSEDLSIDGYTITVQGQYGHTFCFDMCIEYFTWVTPRSLVQHYEKTMGPGVEQLGPPWQPNVLQFFMKEMVEHSLGAYWVCPEHVPEYGGKPTVQASEVDFCLEMKKGDIFPLAMLSLLHLCIEDTHIWKMGFEHDLKQIEYISEVETEWPSGRPHQDREYL
tara:strand:+ start:823 stop:1620 length:798 start_codon:yes stop_codon:yes gene_type:complete